MSLERANKKLREASFFLEKMREIESLAFGDREPFDFFLSAFLSSARSVQFYLDDWPWFDAWVETLTAEERALFPFLRHDRNAEIHKEGSSRVVRTQSIAIGNEYRDRSGRLRVFAPPGAPSASINRPTYVFVIDGIERNAVDVSTVFLGLLRTMLGRFVHDHPSP